MGWIRTQLLLPNVVTCTLSHKLCVQASEARVALSQAYVGLLWADMPGRVVSGWQNFFRGLLSSGHPAQW